MAVLNLSNFFLCVIDNFIEIEQSPLVSPASCFIYLSNRQDNMNDTAIIPGLLGTERRKANVERHSGCALEAGAQEASPQEAGAKEKTPPPTFDKRRPG